jgi:hypothetical protein
MLYVCSIETSDSFTPYVITRLLHPWIETHRLVQQLYQHLPDWIWNSADYEAVIFEIAKIQQSADLESVYSLLT